MIITPRNQTSPRLQATHFSSTNDCGSVRLNVVSTGSPTGLVTSNQLEREKEIVSIQESSWFEKVSKYLETDETKRYDIVLT